MGKHTSQCKVCSQIYLKLRPERKLTLVFYLIIMQGKPWSKKYQVMQNERLFGIINKRELR
jgi:hypothetical protein